MPTFVPRAHVVVGSLDVHACVISKSCTEGRRYPDIRFRLNPPRQMLVRVVVTTKLCYHTCRHPKSSPNAQSLRQVLEQVVVATKLCYHVPICCQAANGLADQHGDQHVCGNVSDVRGVTTTCVNWIRVSGPSMQSQCCAHAAAGASRVWPYRPPAEAFLSCNPLSAALCLKQ